MSRKTGSAWRAQQGQDPYFKLAKKCGFRSRAAFKLEEIDRQEKLFHPGSVVVDLGAAPGSWSQVAIQRVSNSGRVGHVVAVDLLPMSPLAGVDFIQGDFLDIDVQRRLHEVLMSKEPTLVISDMAPNISGIRLVDQTKSLHLADQCLQFCRTTLALGGSLLVKIFEGPDVPAYRTQLMQSFNEVKSMKPKASRADSSETYLLAKGFKAKLSVRD